MKFFNKNNETEFPTSKIPHNYKKYDVVLNDDEILKVALLVDKYKHNVVDFNGLEKAAQDEGMQIESVFAVG